MPIPVRATFASSDPRWRIRITDDASPTLVQASTDLAMHSGCGAIAETQHVYLLGSGAAGRLAAGVATRVLEVGLGSSMGWLLTADAALESAAPLFYQGLENQLPPASVVRQLDMGRFIRSRELLEQYCLWLEELPPHEPDAPPASRTALFQFESVTLQLDLGDAVTWCQRTACARAAEPAERFDAIYFDPYSPEANPRLWQRDIFDTMRRLLADDGRLVSYCVSRRVRDALTAAGLLANKRPGPIGGKREVLMAQKRIRSSR